MGIEYLDNKGWWDLSRDERMFCAVLWEHGRKDPEEFARWLNKEANLGIDSSGSWELGYEVVFYRDYLWAKNISAKGEGLHSKRTFDLCLFGEKDLVIIEAKMCMGFDPKQNKIFENDVETIPDLFEKNSPKIHLVGLACSGYWPNLKKHGSKETWKLFKNHKICWKGISELYDDPILKKANGMYQKELDRKKKNRGRKK